MAGRIAAAGLATVSAAFLIKSMSKNKFESAYDAVSNIKIGWNLGNTLDAHGKLKGWNKPAKYETAWKNPITEKSMITVIKKAGFNAVRLPVTWYEHCDTDGDIDTDWLDRVQEIVDYVISQDMYCILDVHHDAGENGWLCASEECYSKYARRFEGLWKNIAKRFEPYSDKLLFEGFNEMLDGSYSWDVPKDSKAYEILNDFNQLFVDTVRSTGGNNLRRNLVIEVYSAACTEPVLDAFAMPDDTADGHIIVQVHNYDPQGFTFPKAPWTTLTDKWGSDDDIKHLDELFARLEKYSDKFGAPMIVGEFGAFDKNNTADRTRYAYEFASRAAAVGIKCFWWDAGGMDILDRRNRRIKFPTIAAALVRGAERKPLDIKA